MANYSELEQEIAKRYKRITGKEPVGLLDTLRILTGPDMLTLLKTHILEIEAMEDYAKNTTPGNTWIEKDE